MAALNDARIDMLSRQAVLVVEAVRQTVAKHWGCGELHVFYYIDDSKWFLKAFTSKLVFMNMLARLGIEYDRFTRGYVLACIDMTRVELLVVNSYNVGERYCSVYYSYEYATGECTCEKLEHWHWWDVELSRKSEGFEKVVHFLRNELMTAEENKADLDALDEFLHSLDFSVWDAEHI